MKRKERPLSRREALFCLHYNRLGDGNGGEAAKLAGYAPESAGRRAEMLLERPEIWGFCKGCGEEKTSASRRALAHLAHGPINDAVQMLMEGEDGRVSDTSGMDLFCVSELRKLKGGGMEVKFHDRIRALEALLELEREEKEGKARKGSAEGLYRALAEGASRSWGNEKEGENDAG